MLGTDGCPGGYFGQEKKKPSKIDYGKVATPTVKTQLEAAILYELSGFLLERMARCLFHANLVTEPRA